MSAPHDRRGFLRGLVTLPLLGGGVTLIGQPTGVAEPATRRLLIGYSEWLRVERQLLHDEMFPTADPEAREFLSEGGSSWVDRFFVPPGPMSWRDLPQPSARDALVLSAVGVDWREGSA